MRRFTTRFFIVLALALGLPLALTGALSAITSGPGVARAASLTVCPGGPPTCDYAIIQEAVNAASEGDVVKIASGNYTHVNHEGAYAQVVYITKSLTLRGGYTTTFDEPPDPRANPTTLDAQGQGRALYITGAISVTIEGLRITGGDANDSKTMGISSGGGGYVTLATITFRNNQIFGNTAQYGGGLRLDSPGACLTGNTFAHNAASGWGGGLEIFGSGNGITLTGNTFSSNTSRVGGGLSFCGNGTLDGNTFSGNVATDEGGGLYLNPVLYCSSRVLINNNTFSGNAAKRGGGMFLGNSHTLKKTPLVTTAPLRMAADCTWWAMTPASSSTTPCLATRPTMAAD